MLVVCDDVQLYGDTARLKTGHNAAADVVSMLGYVGKCLCNRSSEQHCIAVFQLLYLFSQSLLVVLTVLSRQLKLLGSPA